MMIDRPRHCLGLPDVRRVRMVGGGTAACGEGKTEDMKTDDNKKRYRYEQEWMRMQRKERKRMRGR